jgi:NitT/TauT family transport system ATP-binding protein
MTMVQLENVTHTFIKGKGEDRQETCAIKGANFEVKKGEFFVMLGPSGCGKTTLLRLMHGLLKPRRGTIKIDGEVVKGPKRDRAMVFQTFSLFPWKNTIDNVAFGLELAGIQEGERRKTAQKYVDLVGLTGFERHYPHELSGGMKQRVGIARALVMDPKILLMDEPFGFLDALTRMTLQTELLHIWSSLKKTIVFITHDLDESIYLADRVVLLKSRPASVKTIYPIDLPRPRTHDMQNTDEFQAIRKTIWEDLKEELDLKE